VLDGVPIGIHMLDVFFEDVAEMGLDESGAIAEIMIGVRTHNFVDPKMEDDLMREILKEYQLYLEKIGKK
jgi:hypothetical protein